MKKIVLTVLAAVLAASTLIVPASAADDRKPVTGLGIFPALASPFALAGILGPTTQTTTVTKFFKFYPNQKWGWYKIKYLKANGWEVDKYYKHRKIKVHAKHETKSKNIHGKAIVGCIMGSAFGAITAAVRKGNAMGNPLRWRSQAEHEAIVKSGYEKQFELTNDEAAIALSFCGLGSLALNWQQAPVAVKAKF
jgi:hypothetical protein